MDYCRLTASIMQAKFHLVTSNNGVALQAVKRGIVSKHPRAKRGEVKGFSTASCRRLRHLLFKVDYSKAVAVTLTRPCSHDAEFFALRDSETAFEQMNRHAGRFPFVKSLIWRKEVQENGTPHYHCILIPSDGFEGVAAGEMLVEAWIKEVFGSFRSALALIASQVEASGDSLQAVLDADAKEAFEAWSRAKRQELETKMRKAHHDKRRPCIRSFDDSTGYVRYVLDHQSKHKDYQAKTTGRAWGVWNRSKLPTADYGFEDLTEEEFYRLGRCLRKVARYRVNDSRSPFGWYHSSGRRVQQNGITDYFGRLTDGSLSSAIKAYLEGMR